MARILIVDDEPGVCAVLEALFARSGFEVQVAHTGAGGLAIIEAGMVDLVLADKNLPDMSGMEIIRVCGQRRDGPDAMLITAYGSLESAIEAMDLGARGYLLKPFDDLEEVVTKVRKLLAAAEDRRKFQALVDDLRAANEKFAAEKKKA